MPVVKQLKIPLACIHGFICSIRIHIKLINIWYSSCMTQSISTYTLASFNFQCEKKGSWCQKILTDMAGLLVGKHGIWFGSQSKSGELGFRKFQQFNQAIIAKLSWMRLLLIKTSFVSSVKRQVWTYSKKWQRWLKGKDYWYGEVLKKL